MSASLVIYDGPSALTGDRIIAIVTGLDGSSANRKTGAMIQLWIMAADAPPVLALKTGMDRAVCGGCKLAGILGQGRTCYVNLGQAPTSVWNAWREGRTLVGSPEDVAAIAAARGLPVRLGAYGDPAALPLGVVRALVSGVPGWTGYTHQWRSLDAAEWAPLIMASADTPADAYDAWAAGWRSFRSYASSATGPTAWEVECPSERGVSCADCGLCAGTSRAARSIAIRVHGSGAMHHPERRTA